MRKDLSRSPFDPAQAVRHRPGRRRPERLRRVGLESVTATSVGIRRPARSSARPFLGGMVLVAAAALIVSAGNWPTSQAGANGASMSNTDNQLSISVRLDKSEVAPGEDVNLDVTIQNARVEPAALSVDACGVPATMYALVAIPVDPAGREWDGIAGEFKRFVVAKGFRDGGNSATEPRKLYAQSAAACREGETEMVVPPGESIGVALVWTAELAADVAALPGPVTFEVTIGHDPTGSPPTYPPDYDGPLGSWVTQYKTLTVDGTINVIGAASPVVTMGQALDAVLGDEQFAAWLAGEPSSTWSIANAFLLSPSAAEGIIPAGPSWEIDLFREAGISRSWAIAFVDPATGAVKNVTFCDEPCDR
jgi:hypothetical protein